ncbi:Hypothetical predicted protein, partial [Paramuricea clavata]
LMIFTAIYRVLFTGENIVERLASGSRLMTLTSTSTTTKKFLYLVMGKKCLPVHMRGESNIGNGHTCNCDIIMFGYKEKCHEAKNANLEHVEYIHRDGTTWNTGRNYLYEHAMKRETVYLYYIFVDGDATLRPNADTNANVTSLGLWRSFENFLVEYEPAVGITTYCHNIHHPCFKQRNKPGGNGVYVLSGWLFDACFNAFHRDALPYLLPYNLKHEKASWCYSQHYVATLAKHYFSGSVLIYGNVNIMNGGHRDYPRTSDSKRFKEQHRVISKYVEKITKSRKKPEWKSRINVSETMDKHFCKC